jgi:hypothetical protein
MATMPILGHEVGHALSLLWPGFPEECTHIRIDLPAEDKAIVTFTCNLTATQTKSLCETLRHYRLVPIPADDPQHEIPAPAIDEMAWARRQGI